MHRQQMVVLHTIRPAVHKGRIIFMFRSILFASLPLNGPPSSLPTGRPASKRPHGRGKRSPSGTSALQNMVELQQGLNN